MPPHPFPPPLPILAPIDDVQVAAYTGVLQVNWRKVEDNVITLLDQDGDRKLTKKDLSVVWKRVKTLLVHQLPSSGRWTDTCRSGQQASKAWSLPRPIDTAV